MKASLNHIFRTVWSDVLGAWVAVSELTKAKGKSASGVTGFVAGAHGAETARPGTGFWLRPLFAALVFCCGLGAEANPLGAQIVNGTVSINQAGSTLNITNTPGSIINWQAFSIGTGETTNFIQQSAGSAVLNRVVGPDPSALLGRLSSNGQVYLINPAGIMVGQGAVIDVPRFVASTLNLSNTDFLAGRMNFTALPGAGSISNQGTITTPEGGTVYLVAPQVENKGLISTPKGETILAAGDTVTLLETGTPGVTVQITGGTNNATNLGQIVADTGRVGMVGALVKNSGVLNASSLVSQGGRIFLKATQTTTVDAGSQVTATGTTGGTVEVLGNQVAVTGNAVLDASGTNGGGTVLVGGDAHGANPNVQNAQATFVDSGVAIKVDAVQSGNGGKAVVWSDIATQFNGNISAKGGAQGGDGGWVETSGKQWLNFAGVVDTTAAHGKMGSLLLDPISITISNAADTLATPISSNGAGPCTYTLLAGWACGNAYVDNTTLGMTSNLNVTTLQNALATSNVVVTTASTSGSAAAGADNITVQAPIAWSSASNLSLMAGGSITVDAGASIANTGTGSLWMEAGSAAGITINAPISMAGGRVELDTLALGGTVTNNSTIYSGLADLTTNSAVQLGSDQMIFGAGSSISAPNGIVLLVGHQGNITNVDLGATTKGTANTLELSAADLGTITAAIKGIVAPTGNITISQNLSSPTTVFAIASGNITTNANVNVSGDARFTAGWDGVSPLSNPVANTVGTGNLTANPGSSLGVTGNLHLAAGGNISISDASVYSTGNMLVDVGGNLTLAAATSWTGLQAGMQGATPVVSTQTINFNGAGVHTLNLSGGSGAASGAAATISSTGLQTIGYTGGTLDITLTGGTTNNNTQNLFQWNNGVQGTQICATCVTQNWAGIESQGGQTINASSILMTAGSGGHGNHVSIWNNSTTVAQNVTVTNALSVTGGASGGYWNSAYPNDGAPNDAGIGSSGTQSISAGSITMRGSPVGAAPAVTIGGAFLSGKLGQTITASGLSMTGGNSTATGATAGQYGLGSAAIIGDQAGQSVSLNISGSLLMDGGGMSATSGAMIGAASGAPTISITAGMIGMVNGAQMGVLTGGPAGSLTMTATGTGLAISEDALSAINTATLTATAANGINLIGLNRVASFSASNTVAGNIGLVNSYAPFVVTALSDPVGNVSIQNWGGIIVVGPLSSSGTFDLFAHSPITVNAGASITAGGAVTLTAGAAGSTAAGDVITLNGTVSGASITLAGNKVTGTIPAGAILQVSTAPPPPTTAAVQQVVTTTTTNTAATTTATSSTPATTTSSTGAPTVAPVVVATSTPTTSTSPVNTTGSGGIGGTTGTFGGNDTSGTASSGGTTSTTSTSNGGTSTSGNGASTAGSTDSGTGGSSGTTEGGNGKEKGKGEESKEDSGKKQNGNGNQEKSDAKPEKC